MSKNHRAIHYTREVIKESISNNKIKAKNSSLTGACLAEQERKGDFQSTDLDFHGAWCIGPCWGFLQPCCRGWWYGIHTLWGNAEAHLHPQWCCRPQLQEKPEGHKLWLYHPWVNTVQKQGHLLPHLLPDRISDHFLGEAAKELTPPEKSGRVDDHVHTWHRTWFFFFFLTQYGEPRSAHLPVPPPYPQLVVQGLKCGDDRPTPSTMVGTDGWSPHTAIASEQSVPASVWGWLSWLCSLFHTHYGTNEFKPQVWVSVDGVRQCHPCHYQRP